MCGDGQSRPRAGLGGEDFGWGARLSLGIEGLERADGERGGRRSAGLAGMLYGAMIPTVKVMLAGVAALLGGVIAGPLVVQLVVVRPRQLSATHIDDHRVTLRGVAEQTLRALRSG